MQLSDIFVALGEPAFHQLIRSVSIGKLKTYQLYERVKMRFHMTKLNTETLRKVAPRLWTRIAEQDEEFATDVAQTMLVSHLDMIKDVLDLLGFRMKMASSLRISMRRTSYTGLAAARP